MEGRIIMRKCRKYIEHAMSCNPSRKLYGIITQKTTILIFTVMRTSKYCMLTSFFFIIMQRVVRVFVNSLLEILYINYLYFDNVEQNNSDCIVRLKSTLVCQHVQLVYSSTAGNLACNRILQPTQFSCCPSVVLL